MKVAPEDGEDPEKTKHFTIRDEPPTEEEKAIYKLFAEIYRMTDENGYWTGPKDSNPPHE